MKHESGYELIDVDRVMQTEDWKYFIKRYDNVSDEELCALKEFNQAVTKVDGNLYPKSLMSDYHEDFTLPVSQVFKECVNYVYYHESLFDNGLTYRYSISDSIYPCLSAYQMGVYKRSDEFNLKSNSEVSHRFGRLQTSDIYKAIAVEVYDKSTIEWETEGY